jgi:hypothetical protein
VHSADNISGALRVLRNISPNVRDNGGRR